MENTEKLGIKETTELVDLVVDLAKVIVEATKDGKITVEDATLLFRLIPALGPAFQDVAKMPAEIKDMDVAEATELVAHVAARLSLDNEKAQAIVEKSLKLAVMIYDLVVTITKKA